MEIFLAFVTGGVFAASVYLMLRRSLVRLVIGLILLTNAVNLMVFTLGQLTRGLPPLIEAGQEVPAGVVANPLPQALILTAVVISFGLTAFALVLVYMMNEKAGTLDSKALKDVETQPGDG